MRDTFVFLNYVYSVVMKYINCNVLTEAFVRGLDPFMSDS
jgi:hypothetical protein